MIAVPPLAYPPNDADGRWKPYDDANESDYSLCRESHDGECSIEEGTVNEGFGLAG